MCVFSNFGYLIFGTDSNIDFYVVFYIIICSNPPYFVENKSILYPFYSD